MRPEARIALMRHLDGQHGARSPRGKSPAPKGRTPRASQQLERDGDALIAHVDAADVSACAPRSSDIELSEEDSCRSACAQRASSAAANRRPLAQKAIARRALLDVIEPPSRRGLPCHRQHRVAQRAGAPGRTIGMSMPDRMCRARKTYRGPTRIPYPIFAIGYMHLLKDCPLEAGTDGGDTGIARFGMSAAGGQAGRSDASPIKDAKRLPPGCEGRRWFAVLLAPDAWAPRDAGKKGLTAALRARSTRAAAEYRAAHQAHSGGGTTSRAGSHCPGGKRLVRRPWPDPAIDRLMTVEHGSRRPGRHKSARPNFPVCPGANLRRCC